MVFPSQLRLPRSSSVLRALKAASNSLAALRLISANRTCRSTCTAGGATMLSTIMAPVDLATSTARATVFGSLTFPDSVTELPLAETVMFSSGIRARR